MTALRRIDLATGAELVVQPLEGLAFDGTLSAAFDGVVLFSSAARGDRVQRHHRRLAVVHGRGRARGLPIRVAQRIYLTQGIQPRRRGPAYRPGQGDRLRLGGQRVGGHVRGQGRRGARARPGREAGTPGATTSRAQRVTLAAAGLPLAALLRRPQRRRRQRRPGQRPGDHRGLHAAGTKSAAPAEPVRPSRVCHTGVSGSPGRRVVRGAVGPASPSSSVPGRRDRRGRRVARASPGASPSASAGARPGLPAPRARRA